jgi:hypothetical protein
MKFRLIYLLYIVGLFSTGAWSQEQVCEGDPVDEIYEQRWRWYVVNGGDQADTCKESRPIYQELNALLDDYRYRTVLRIDASQIALRAGSIAREYDLAIDMSNLTVNDMISNDTWLQGKVFDQVVEFPDNCKSQSAGVSEACDSEFESFKDRLSFAYFMSEITDEINKPELEADLLHSARRVAKWNKYLDSQQFQYPWELSLNYCWQQPGWSEEDSRWGRAGCFIPGVGSGIGRRIQDEHSQLGWEEVPEWRYTYLHPDVAVSYSGEPSQGDRVNAALLFEWVGVYWWKWNDDWAKESDSVYDCFLSLCPVGLSVVTTLIDLPDNDAVGYGLALHVHNFTLAATKHDGERGADDAWVYSVSLNLAQLFAERGGGSGKALKSLFLK